MGYLLNTPGKHGNPTSACVPGWGHRRPPGERSSKAAVPTPATGTGRQRGAVHHLEDLQEGAAHLTGQHPTRGDSADGTQEGGLPHWCSPRAPYAAKVASQGATTAA